MTRADDRRQAIKLATHKGFRGITKSFLSKLISKSARVDEVLTKYSANGE